MPDLKKAAERAIFKVLWKTLHCMRQLAVMVENKVGELAKVTGLLAKKGINIDGISQEVMGDRAVIRITTKDYEKATGLLRGANYPVSLSSVLVVSLDDKPGQVEKVARKLASKKVSVENIYHLHPMGKKILVAIKVDNFREGKKALGSLVVNA